MPHPLPLKSLTVPVTQHAARMSDSLLSRFRAVILLLPAQMEDADWARTPQARAVRRLHARKPRRAGDVFTLQVGAEAATLLIVGISAADCGTFERLQLARKCAQAALEGEPPQVLIGHLHTDPSAQAALLATLAALQAAAFALPTFKSKPARKTRSSRKSSLALIRSPAQKHSERSGTQKAPFSTNCTRRSGADR